MTNDRILLTSKRGPTTSNSPRPDNTRIGSAGHRKPVRRVVYHASRGSCSQPCGLLRLGNLSRAKVRHIPKGTNAFIAGVYRE